MGVLFCYTFPFLLAMFFETVELIALGLYFCCRTCWFIYMSELILYW